MPDDCGGGVRGVGGTDLLVTAGVVVGTRVVIGSGSSWARAWLDWPARALERSD